MQIVDSDRNTQLGIKQIDVTFNVSWGEGEEESLRGGFAPSFIKKFPLSSIKERGIKRVPRKIKDFSGCFKGVRLP